MAYDPFSKRPASFPSHSRTFETGGGETVTLTFRKLDAIAKYRSHERGEQLKELYAEDFRFPPVGGEAIKHIPETMLIQAAWLETMQPYRKPGEEDAERYTAEEFIAMQLTLDDAVWNNMQEFANEVTDGTVGDIPPPSSGDTKTSSVSP